METRLWPSIIDKMEGQHRAFQLLEGASLQRPYPLTLQAWGRPRASTKGKAVDVHQGEVHVAFPLVEGLGRPQAFNVKG